MEGRYITPDGQKVEVSSFDAENKMVSVHLQSGQYRFYSEWEYSLWKKDGQPVLSGTITHIQPEQEKVEVKKPKKASKK